MSCAPILLLQWLRPDELRETQCALSSDAHTIDIMYIDVQLKADACKAISEWLTDNNNVQYLFIDAHEIIDEKGVHIGVGASLEKDQYVEWCELWSWLAERSNPFGVWFRACKSSDVAKAWPPAVATQPAVDYWVSFKDVVGGVDLAKVFDQFLKNASRPITTDREIEILRSSVSPKVEMYYIASSDEAGLLRRSFVYMNVDDIPSKLGKTFAEHVLNS